MKNKILWFLLIILIINIISLKLKVFFSSFVLDVLSASLINAYKYIPRKHNNIKPLVLVMTPSFFPDVKKPKLNMNKTTLENIQYIKSLVIIFFLAVKLPNSPLNPHTKSKLQILEPTTLPNEMSFIP